MSLDRALQGIALSFFSATYRVFGLHMHIPWTGPAHYAATSAFITSSLRRCCKSTAHCNKSRDPVDLLEKLSLRRKLR